MYDRGILMVVCVIMVFRTGVRSCCVWDSFV